MKKGQTKDPNKFSLHRAPYRRTYGKHKEKKEFNNPEFEKALKENFNKIKNFCRRLEYDQDKAELLFSALLEKLVVLSSTFTHDDTKGQFTSWVYAIARTTKLELYNKESKLNIYSIDERDGFDIPEDNEEEPAPDNEEKKKSLLALFFAEAERRYSKFDVEIFKKRVLEDIPRFELERQYNISANQSRYIVSKIVLMANDPKVIQKLNQLV